MDKLDIILEKLQSLDRIEPDIKAIKNDNKEIHKKLNTIEQHVDQTWQAVKEIRGING